MTALVAPSQAAPQPEFGPRCDVAFTLVSSPTCAFAARLNWAVQELQATNKVETILVDLGESRPDWLARVSAANEVPVLIDSAGRRVHGNSAILLECASIALGTTAVDLRPADAHMYAAARAVLAAFDAQVALYSETAAVPCVKSR